MKNLNRSYTKTILIYHNNELWLESLSDNCSFLKQNNIFFHPSEIRNILYFIHVIVEIQIAVMTKRYLLSPIELVPVFSPEDHG